MIIIIHIRPIHIIIIIIKVEQTYLGQMTE